MPDKPKVPDAGADLLVRRGVKLVHLRLFVALREAGKITDAAAMLSMTQSGASRLLAEIESAVAAKLYRRHPRGVVLTEAGRLFADSATRILQDLDRARRDILDLENGGGGRVAIGAVMGPALELVLPVIHESRRVNPRQEVTLIVDMSDRLAAGLMARTLDFYIGRVSPEVDVRDLDIRPIGPEPFCLIVRENHPLLQKPDLTLADCLPYDWVMQPPGGLARNTVENYLAECGLCHPENVVSTSSLIVTLGLVEQSDAIAPVARAVADFHAGHLHRAFRKLPVAPDLAISSFSLIRRRGEEPTAAAASAYDMLEALISTNVGKPGSL
ncbi:MAG: LysR family transcriptional regulator [Pseudorhodobacter sp.]